MKKTLFTLTTLAFFSLTALAQNAQTGTTIINKASQPCVYAEYQYEGSIVEGALKKKFADAKIGSDSKATDGFRVYKGVVVPQLTNEKIDLYVKVEEKKPMSTVYMLTSKGYDNFMKKETDSNTINNSIAFLNNFMNDVLSFKLGKDIEKQEDVINDAEKKNKNIAKDGESLLKEKSKIESRISKTNIEIGSLKSDMENQQKMLETVKAKTATIEQMEALKKEVSKQEDAVKKATKKYEGALKDAEDNAKDLKKNEEEIAKNKTEQDAQITEVKKQREILEGIKAERSRIIIK